MQQVFREDFGQEGFANTEENTKALQALAITPPEQDTSSLRTTLHIVGIPDGPTASRILSQIHSVSPDSPQLKTLKDRIEVAAELAGQVELGMGNARTRGISDAMVAGMRLGLSLFQEECPATMAHAVLLESANDPLLSKDLINEKEHQLLIEEASSSLFPKIEDNNPLLQVIHNVLEDNMTPYESAFVRGLLKAVLPSLDLPANQKDFEGPLNHDEATLLEAITGKSQPNLNADASLSADDKRSKIVTLKDFEVTAWFPGNKSSSHINENWLKGDIYQARRDELLSQLESRYSKEVFKHAKDYYDNLDSKKDAFMAFGGIGMTVTFITLFAYWGATSPQTDMSGWVAGISLAMLVVGGIAGKAWNSLATSLHKEKGKTLIDDLQGRLDSWHKKLGDDSSAWVEEGIRMDLLDPVTYKPKAYLKYISNE